MKSAFEELPATGVSRGGTPLLRRSPHLALLAAALAYAALLLYRYRTVPDGLVNDAAEEALRGLILVEERRAEVLTFVLGNSAETLWLYVVGLSAKLLGPSVFALALPSALAAAATAVLVTLVASAVDPETPWLAPFLLAAGSPWLFHYGRSGLRAISAPLFLALAALLLARAAREPARPGPFLWVGAAVGASLYGYTACRLLPAALALALATAWRADRDRRRAWLRAGAAVGLGFAAASLPNILFFATHPSEFLARGSYVAIGSGGGWFANVVATALLPLDMPHRYGFIWGDFHVFDGVSAGLTGSGLVPVPLAAGILFAGGLVWRLARRRDVTTLFLAYTLALAVALLGPTGPSLTRLLVLVPVYVIFASFGAGALMRSARARTAVLAGLVLVGAHALVRYFSCQSDPSRASREYVASAQTAMGERARAASANGQVLCIVTESANVVRYLAHGSPVTVVEFYQRAFDPREAEPAPSVRTLFVEANQRLAAWRPEGWAEAGGDTRFRVLAPAVTPPTGP
jgi:hypothetical protein